MAAASTLSVSFPLDPQSHYPRSFKTHPFPLLSTSSQTLLNYPSFKLSSSRFHSSPSSLPTLDDPFRSGRFLTDDEFRKLNFLETFLYSRQLHSGSLFVRVMRNHELDLTVRLLAESFAESMFLPSAYLNVLRFLVKQYLIERRTLMPHTATLVGFYRGNNNNNNNVDSDGGEDEDEDEEMQLAGTVEVCFDKRGANASLPSPTPPRDSPYISNMAVQKSLRRRGIGWHLLKASEELISQMSSSREVYLHCRMIDEAPFNMYTKADYKVVKTDSILVLLMLQRRKYLMCKKLPPLNTAPDLDLSGSDE